MWSAQNFVSVGDKTFPKGFHRKTESLQLVDDLEGAMKPVFLLVGKKLNQRFGRVVDEQTDHVQGQVFPGPSAGEFNSCNKFDSSFSSGIPGFRNTGERIVIRKRDRAEPKFRCLPYDLSRRINPVRSSAVNMKIGENPGCNCRLDGFLPGSDGGHCEVPLSNGRRRNATGSKMLHATGCVRPEPGRILSPRIRRRFDSSALFGYTMAVAR